jgi:hypothetical protein
LVQASPLLASNDLTVPQVLCGSVRPGFADQEVIVSSGLWQGTNLEVVLIGELSVEDAKILSHPPLIEALGDDTVAHLIHPPYAHLHTMSMHGTSG